jgi:anti-anti-sigma factor
MFSASMQLSFEQLHELLVVTVAGRLDTASAPEFDAQVGPLLAEPLRNIVLDLSEVTYISSAGVHSLLHLIKYTASQGGRVGLFAVRPQVMEIIDMSGFPTLLDIYPDRAAALGSRTL